MNNLDQAGEVSEHRGKLHSFMFVHRLHSCDVIECCMNFRVIGRSHRPVLSLLGCLSCVASGSWRCVHAPGPCPSACAAWFRAFRFGPWPWGCDPHLVVL